MEPVIRVENLCKTYRIYGNPYHRLRERLPWNRGKKLHKSIPALQDVNLTVMPGQCVGLVGGNGAGKSTLLKILTGTTFPTQGSYTIHGRVAALLELGAGFHSAFSGRANIFMNAVLMGHTPAQVEAKYQEILDFSELHQFINQPIRTYSSGMVARLGFSVAVATDPDILIIDEILAVGDMHFRKKCVDKIMEFRDRGKTMFFCSHSLYDVRQICEKAIWLRNGRVEMFDDAVTVTNEYATYENQIVAAQDVNRHQIEIAEVTGAPQRDTEDLPRILSARLVDPRTNEPRSKFQPHEAVGVRVHVKNGRNYELLHLAVGFTRNDGSLCFAPTTEMDGVPLEFNEGVVTLVIPEIKLLSGEFVVPVWLIDHRGVHRFHEMPCAENLIVQNRSKELGLFYTEREWRVEVLEPPPAAARGQGIDSSARRP